MKEHMTVKELKDVLKDIETDYGENAEVVVFFPQKYGSDLTFDFTGVYFGREIFDVKEEKKNVFNLKVTNHNE